MPRTGPWSGRPGRLGSTDGRGPSRASAFASPSASGEAPCSRAAGAITRILLLALSVAVGVTYAGTVNIMLNGLGVVLSPRENPGFLPGLNAGAFNLGAGLSFAALYAVATAFTPDDPRSAAGFAAGMFAGAVILTLALATSLLIPRPVDAEERAPVPEAPQGTSRA